MSKFLVLIVFSVLSLNVFAHEEKKEDKSFWWKADWWDGGQLREVTNHKVKIEWTEYDRDDVTVPTMVARPDDNKKYPAVIFQHGRAGLSKLLQLQVKRIAARGFVVMAPDIYQANFIGTHPYPHDYELEKDASAVVDVLLARSDVSSSRACIVSHTRGGYYSLKTAVTFKHQKNNLACYVSYYPHWQDPNAPEPAQVYGYAPEIESLKLPTLVFIGEQEQYQRRRVIETSIEILKKKQIEAHLIVYPGIGRGFDFRPPHVRTFADDLASKDAIQRSADFIKHNLSAYSK
ncbi:MAG: dienelactone hydrolase family protein [Gammaproteobacteria bacterium]|nr:dienelactone hydrolase family protein [Gammaproteobacteria bacterium]